MGRKDMEKVGKRGGEDRLLEMVGKLCVGD